MCDVVFATVAFRWGKMGNYIAISCPGEFQSKKRRK